MIRISQGRESCFSTNTMVRKNELIQESRAMGVAVRDPSRKVNHLNKFI